MKYFNFFILLILIACNNPDSNSEANKSSETIKDTANVIKDVTRQPPDIDLWLNDSIISDSLRQLMLRLSSVSELTRTWIQFEPGSKSLAVLDRTKPSATYQTTLIKVDMLQHSTNVQAEVRRYGRMLLGFAIGKNKLPVSNPEWLGYDAADKLANVVDSFYTSVQHSDSMAVINGNNILTFFPKDLEFRTYTAVAAKKRKDKVTLDKLKDSLMNEKISTDGLKKLFEEIMVARNFDMINSIAFVTAYRESFGKLIRKLK